MEFFVTGMRLPGMEHTSSRAGCSFLVRKAAIAKGKTKETVERMDKFEETMRAIAKMPASEQMMMIDAKKAVCICPKCPTYTNCAKNAKELLFCATGKSFMCIPSEKGCKCPDCPVTSDLGLKFQSFCTRGAEKAQRYEHAIWGTKMV